MTDDARHALLKADALFKAGDLDGAEAAYDAIDFATCNEVEVVFQAFNNRGALMVRRGRAAEAIANFESAVAVDDSDGDAWFNLAALANAGSVGRPWAPTAASRSGRPSPPSSAARALAALGRHEEAAAAAAAAVARAGGAWPTATWRLRRGARPARRRRSAPRRTPATAATTARLVAEALRADLLARGGDLGGALALYRSALAGGGDAAARYNYALLLQRSGDGAGAVAELRRVRGDAAGAEPHLAKTSDLAPGDSERSYNVGVCLLKRATSARAALQAILARDPAHELAAAALATIGRARRSRGADGPPPLPPARPPRDARRPAAPASAAAVYYARSRRRGHARGPASTLLRASPLSSIPVGSIVLGALAIGSVGDLVVEVPKLGGEGADYIGTLLDAAFLGYATKRSAQTGPRPARDSCCRSTSAEGGARPRLPGEALGGRFCRRLSCDGGSFVGRDGRVEVACSGGGWSAARRAARNSRRFFLDFRRPWPERRRDPAGRVFLSSAAFFDADLDKDMAVRIRRATSSKRRRAASRVRPAA
ncbi:protein N-acetylglucosaminyltransferase [Aureococcus anophagefferens]|nr:protein N-acetylglucosaminyltransferase [Aureococcus anophagefferens]